MTIFEAALKVLEEHGGGPLHYREITCLAMEKGYFSTEGLTPWYTLHATLCTRIEKSAELQEDPEVLQTGRGLFALAKQVKRGPLREISEGNIKVKVQLLGKLMQVHPRAFEQLIGELLTEIGFENVAVTKYIGDGGIDIEAELTVGGVTNVKTAIQVKRHVGNIPGKVVRELRGSLTTDQRGLIMSTSGFTKDAIAEASAEGKTPISLVDGKKLVELLVQYQVGVSRKTIDYLELDLDRLDEQESDTDSTGKALSLLSMPGGKEAYVESTLILAKYIAQAKPDYETLEAYMKKTFERVQTDSVVASRIRMLKTLGLAKYDGENIVLTDEGASLLAMEPRVAILKQLRTRVAGITEIERLLASSPQKLSEIKDLLKTKLNVSWETDTQTKIRLAWLEAVGVVDSNNGIYQLME